MNVAKYSICLLLTLSISCIDNSDQSDKAFPYIMPTERPNINLSESMERVYDQFKSPTPQDNELYSSFFYTTLKGFEYDERYGTITRRDPSRIVKANGKYYMWYTKRHTPTTFLGPDHANDTIPSTDWDLCEIWYATSRDGFTWEEQGVAVERPEEPAPGWRSVSTPDVLVWKGRYYLYYQAFSTISGKRSDDCPVSASYAESPDGPWTPTNRVIIPNGAEGEWDQLSIHDPYPIVFKDKIYFYYKSDYNGKSAPIRSTGLAVGDDPLGVFVKHSQNPVISSGHETQMFRFKDGIAAIMAKDGHENNTIQYSEDGVNFHAASNCSFMPIAAGVYDPDAFTGSDNAEGISWGISHHNIWGEGRHSIILRFDCDLSTKVNDPQMKRTDPSHTLDELLKRQLTSTQKNRIINQTKL